MLVLVNKMDLVAFSEEIYKTIKSDFHKLLKERDYQEQRITFIPVSALKGDNIVHKSETMTWYSGQTLLEHLEVLDFKDIYNVGTPRFPVQSVIRPKIDAFRDFRGYAGKVYGGELSIGDSVLVLPSKAKTKIKSIYFYDQEVQTASRRSSVTLTLEDEINISRGDMITKLDNLPVISKQFAAKIAWMDRETLKVGNKYVIQHGVNKVLAKVDRIHHTINTDFSGIVETVNELDINDIALVSFKLNKPIFYDAFKNHRTNGSFIIINPQSNTTAGAGFIQ